MLAALRKPSPWPKETNAHRRTRERQRRPRPPPRPQFPLPLQLQLHPHAHVRLPRRPIWMMAPSVLLIIRILKFGPGLLARDTLKSILHRSNIISIVLETQPKQVNKPNIQIKYSSSCLLSKTKIFSFKSLSIELLKIFHTRMDTPLPPTNPPSKIIMTRFHRLV